MKKCAEEWIESAKNQNSSDTMLKSEARLKQIGRTTIQRKRSASYFNVLHKIIQVSIEILQEYIYKWCMQREIRLQDLL